MEFTTTQTMAGFRFGLSRSLPVERRKIDPCSSDTSWMTTPPNHGEFGEDGISVASTSSPCGTPTANSRFEKVCSELEYLQHSWAMATPDCSPLYRSYMHPESQTSQTHSVPSSSEVDPDSPLRHAGSSAAFGNFPSPSDPLRPARSLQLETMLADVFKGMLEDAESVITSEEIATICAPLFEQMLTVVEATLQQQTSATTGAHLSSQGDLAAAAFASQIIAHFGAEASKESMPPIKPERSTKVCCHWKKKGFCKYDEACRFLHPQEKRGIVKGKKAMVLSLAKVV